MDQNALSYLTENKEKYAKEVLIGKLRSAGYAEYVISASVTGKMG